MYSGEGPIPISRGTSLWQTCGSCVCTPHRGLLLFEETELVGQHSDLVSLCEWRDATNCQESSNLSGLFPDPPPPHPSPLWTSV